MVEKDLIFLHQKFESRKESFVILNNYLLEKNIVTDDFLDALNEREDNFPTGLEFVEGFGVAIPHTESKYCKKDTIIFVQLDAPIIFRDMETGEEEINAKYIFLLTLTDPSGHIDVLQNLFSLISDKDFFTNLPKGEDVNLYFHYLNSKLNTHREN